MLVSIGFVIILSAVTSASGNVLPSYIIEGAVLDVELLCVLCILLPLAGTEPVDQEYVGGSPGPPVKPPNAIASNASI